jgi:hypothetical protein
MTRLRDSVQIHGWTSETLQRAIGTLADLVRAAGEPKSDNHELAAELIRWLQCAARDDGAKLADYIDGLCPEGPDSSPWDRLQDLLAEDIPLTELTTRLSAQYPDAVQVLCTLLSEMVPESEVWERLDRGHQAAVAALLEFGTRESLAYLLAHVDFLLGSLSDPTDELIRRHHETFQRLAVDVWPSLDWCARASVALFFSERKLPPASLVDLLVEADPEALDREDRAQLVEALVFTEDLRAELALHRIIDAALEEVSRRRSEESVAFVNTALHWLIMEMERELPARQYDRATALGFHVPQRNIRPN